MRTLVLASLRGSSRRLIAGGLAIVLSVAFMSAVLFAMDSAKAHITEQVGAQYTVADTVVANASQIEAAERLAEVPGVDAAAWVATSYAYATIGEGSKETVIDLIASVPAEASLRWQQIERGRLPDGPNQIAVTQTFAEEHDLAVGDSVTFSLTPDTTEEQRETTVVGLVDQPGPENAQFVAAENGIDQLTVGATGEVLIRGSLEALSDRELRAAAGDQAVALTVEEKVRNTVASITAGVNIYGAMLLGFAGIALFVALLVVTNTFTIVLAQRARELALFRCVGAGRGQVLGAVLVESLLLGLLTSVLGIAVGAGIAAGAITLLSNALPEVEGASLAVSGGSVSIAILTGTVVTVLAASAPARRATRVAPLAALRPELALRARSAAGALRLVTGVLALITGAGLIALAVRHDVPEQGMLLGVGGGALTFVGVLLFGPILAPAVVRLLGLIARVGGVPGKVSVSNAVRNPRRTAATTSALLVGVTLITMLTVGAATSQRTMEQAMDDQMPIDLVFAVERGPQFTPLAPEAVRAARDIEGLDRLALERSVTGRVEGEDLVLSSVPLERARGIVRNPKPLGELDDGVLLLGPMQADAAGAKEGDTVSVRIGERKRDFEVTIASDPATPEVLITAADMKSMDSEGQAAVSGIWARYADDVQPTRIGEQLNALQEADPTATVVGSAAMRAMYQQIIDIMLVVAVALLGMAVLIALLGVGNTLSLSVLERVRENALLRALGLTRRQLRGTLAIEAALIAGAAVLLGLGLGIGYGYLGVSTLFAAVEVAPTIALGIPVGRLVLIAAVASTAGVLASVLPARTAANTPPARAL